MVFSLAFSTAAEQGLGKSKMQFRISRLLVEIGLQFRYGVHRPVTVRSTWWIHASLPLVEITRRGFGARHPAIVVYPRVFALLLRVRPTIS